MPDIQCSPAAGERFPQLINRMVFLKLRSSKVDIDFDYEQYGLTMKPHKVGSGLSVQKQLVV